MFWRGIAVVYASKEEIAKRIEDELKPIYPVSLFRYSEADFEKIWKCYDAIIFTMALSGAVRTVCKHAKSKDVDPAVLVVDDKGKYVIPILGAHWGANELVTLISMLLNAEAVITTASENFGVTSVEELARLLFCRIENIKAIVKVNSAILKGEKVCVKGIDKLPDNVVGYTVSEDCEYKVIITDSLPPVLDENTVYLKPYNFSLGIGSKLETDKETIKEAIEETLSRMNIPLSRVKVIASIREKVKNVAEELGIPFRLVSREEINSFEDECLTPQSQKLKEIGLKGVAEISALIAGGKNSRLLLRKMVYNGEVTIAIAGF